MDRAEEYKKMIDSALAERFTEECRWKGLLDGERYSLLAGGKRIRPILVLEFCRVSGGEPETALDAACAVEMLHTYSLIHDDLPCMDNDTLRRGKPTNHVVFGECAATLAGDALQADAFAAVLGSALPPERKARCAAILADAAGSRGMCAGQYLDTMPRSAPPDAEELYEIHSLKTGALLAAACMMGAAAAGASEEQLAAAGDFGKALGMAFQIRDDMLDAESTAEELGKNTGTDEREGKTTFITLFGREKCLALMEELTEKAKENLTLFRDTDFLARLADALMQRRY